MSDPPRLAEGHILGTDYRIERLHAESEFAVGYLGSAVSSGQAAFIRTFDLARHLPEASLPIVRKRFINEAKQLIDLAHPNIERVLAAGDEGSLVYLITESMESAERLDRLLASRRPDWTEGLRLIGQILDGLSEAHRRGHPHRDLAPARIRILGDGTVKVTDFALVKLLHTLRGTREGAFLLQPTNAPEQVKGEEVGPRADVYAVGAIAFEILAGVPPFAGEGDSLREAILSRPPKLPPSAAALPLSLQDFLMKALEKEPANRHESIEAMAAALKRAVAPAAPPAEAPAPAEEAVAPPPPPAVQEKKPPPPAVAPKPAPGRPSVVIVRQSGPPPAIAFGVMLVAALLVGFFVLRFVRRSPGTEGAPAARAGKAATPAQPGLVHDFGVEEEAAPEEDPLEGVVVETLSQEEKEKLLVRLVDDVRNQLSRRNADAARRAMERLDRVAPNDARFYELESQVLSLAIELPPVPKENQEVPLVTVDDPPILAEHHPPAFRQRPPAEHREVVVKALINAEGKVVETVVVEDDEWKSGAIAVEAVKQWSFQPAMADGVKVKVWIAIPIRTGGEWKKPEIRVVAP